MTSSSTALLTSLAELAAARSNGRPKEVIAPSVGATSSVLSEAAVATMLEATASSRATYPIPENVEDVQWRQSLHDAAVEAARDGVCTPPEAYDQIPYMCSVERVDPYAIESAQDDLIEPAGRILD